MVINTVDGHYRVPHPDKAGNLHAMKTKVLISFIDIGQLISTLFCKTSMIQPQWPGGKALDSESRGPGFDTNTGHCVVSLSKTP